MRPRKLKITLPGPGYEGRFRQGFREVDDPYEPGAKITAAVNVRHDVVLWMLNRKEIDLAEYAAGEKFRSLMEKAGMTGAKAVDFSREPVDGRGAQKDMAVPALEAAKELAMAHAEIGADAYKVLWLVVGLNSPEWMQDDKVNWRKRKVARAGVKNSLNSLAKLWGFAGR